MDLINELEINRTLKKPGPNYFQLKVDLISSTGCTLLLAPLWHPGEKGNNAGEIWIRYRGT